MNDHGSLLIIIIISLALLGGYLYYKRWKDWH